MVTRMHDHTQCSYEGQTQGEVKFMSQIVPAKFEGRKIVLVDELVDNGRAQYILFSPLLKAVACGAHRTCMHVSPLNLGVLLIPYWLANAVLAGISAWIARLISWGCVFTSCLVWVCKAASRRVTCCPLCTVE
jgi:hypothetical protein